MHSLSRWPTHTWFQLERESLYSLTGQLSLMISSCHYWVGSQIGAQQAMLTPGWYIPTANCCLVRHHHYDWNGKHCIPVETNDDKLLHCSLVLSFAFSLSISSSLTLDNRTPYIIHVVLPTLQITSSYHYKPETWKSALHCHSSHQVSTWQSMTTYKWKASLNTSMASRLIPWLPKDGGWRMEI